MHNVLSCETHLFWQNRRCLSHRGPGWRGTAESARGGGAAGLMLMDVCLSLQGPVYGGGGGAALDTVLKSMKSVFRFWA